MDNLKHFGIGLHKDKYSHNKILDTLKATFAPTPQVAQQRRDAVVNVVKTVVAPRSSDMIGSSAMVAGRTMATALPTATPTKIGASALGLASTERLGVVSGTTQGLIRNIQSAPPELAQIQRIQKPVNTLPSRGDMVGSTGLITGRVVQSPLTSSQVAKRDISITPASPGMFAYIGGKGYSTISGTPLAKRADTITFSIPLSNRSNDLGMRPPTLQSPGRIGQAIQVASSDRFLTNPSGNAMQNMGALSAASNKPASGSWIYR